MKMGLGEKACLRESDECEGEQEPTPQRLAAAFAAEESSDQRCHVPLSHKPSLASGDRPVIPGTFTCL
jgi:hypothetical protein